MSLYSRLYSLSSRQDLALAGCSVKVNVVDVHASVILSQKFHNYLGTAIAARYTFSMLAGVAICGFEMVRQDGTKIEGIVKEKEQAKQEYEQAIGQGYGAGLGEQQTKDVFSICVGNILPSETVTVNLRFIQPLIDDEKRDQIRFTFPQTYTERYGTAPAHKPAQASTAQQPFNLEMVIQQAGAIKSIACPSGHPISFELGPSNNFATLTLSECLGFLTKDILIVITAQNLDIPRCFVEPHPSPNHLTTAVGLTFVPRFSTPDVDGGMEYVFLIDRSGSMNGQRMNLVRKALVILLRGLPTKDTSFNIVSFGSSSSKLWDTSKAYTQISLDEATQHVDSMEANYGGTEIASALQTVYNTISYPLKKPVAVLLLTDGNAWNIAPCVRATEAAVRHVPGGQGFVRVFTVGIGSGVSTDTCDSIARAGGGISLYFSEGEEMAGKCSRLIRAARTPPIVDLKVSWPGLAQPNDDDEEFELVERLDSASPVLPTISLFDSSDYDGSMPTGPPPKPNVSLPPPPAVQQAPLMIPNLFPGTRTQIYAILSETSFPKYSAIPSSIKIQGIVATTGANVELDVPVTELIPPPNQNIPILHTLAAKALVTDREDGKTDDILPPGIASQCDRDPALKSAYLEQEIIRLGTTYGLTSQYTSFVAVDRRQEVLIKTPCGHPIILHTDDAASKDTQYLRRRCFNCQTTEAASWRRSVSHPGKVVCNKCGLYERTHNRPRPVSLAERQSAPSRQEPTPENGTITTVEDRLASLARLQQFDGGFKLTALLLSLLRLSIHDVVKVQLLLEVASIDRDVGATALAWLWLTANAGDAGLAMKEKAEQWISKILGSGGDMESVASKVRGVFTS